METHNANHPDTDYDPADLFQVDPRGYQRTDVLWASLECTRGRRRNIDATPDLFDEVLPNEAAERSRATMWDVVRFAEYHRYRAVVLEAHNADDSDMRRNSIKARLADANQKLERYTSRPASAPAAWSQR